ncbi:MAG: hypothetical protein O2955_00705 [Planctomycetota bacterium]|nr:hypothetical protein [Planctomycetota bacterium]MDA1211001.1 hypothetical protein [Planctomycetota bacterium]
MKKLVAYLVSADEPETSSEDSPPEFSPKFAEPGAIKVEAFLSDGDAERILNAVAACRFSSTKQLFLTYLVDQELASAGPEAHNLWTRIVAAVERRLICQVYNDCNGVKTHAAARLGIDRNTLHKKLRQYHLIDDAEQIDNKAGA